MTEAVTTEEAIAPQQIEMPFAMVNGVPVLKLPEDLYIPPDALEVILEAFEGPLDLLLYLIKRQNLDILDIPIAQITKQYIVYVELMKDMQLELAAEYLLMAAMLAEIKSRMLLPRQVIEEEDELDPRAELVRRLQEYEQYKKAAEDIEALPRQGRDTFQVSAQIPDLKVEQPKPEVDLKDLFMAFADVVKRIEINSSHQIIREPLSIRERMTDILNKLNSTEFLEFKSLFNKEEGRMGVVVSFIAILELLKQSVLEIVQNEAFGTIHIKAAA